MIKIPPRHRDTADLKAVRDAIQKRQNLPLVRRTTEQNPDHEKAAGTKEFARADGNRPRRLTDIHGRLGDGNDNAEPWNTINHGCGDRCLSEKTKYVLTVVVLLALCNTPKRLGKNKSGIWKAKTNTEKEQQNDSEIETLWKLVEGELI